MKIFIIIFIFCLKIKYKFITKNQKSIKNSCYFLIFTEDNHIQIEKYIQKPKLYKQHHK